MGPYWHIELFKSLRARRLPTHDPGEVVIESDSDESEEVSRFRSQQAAMLLAYLAYHRGQAFERETLIEMLWPDCDERSGRNRLSVALSSLRSQLETTPDSIFLADRETIRLRENAVTTDVAAFEDALRRTAEAAGRSDPEAAKRSLSEALDAYGGRLLSGFYDEWVLTEQRRLEEEYFRAARRAVKLHRDAGDLRNALSLVKRAVAFDPTREDLQRELVRLLAATGQWDAARRQGREIERILREQLGSEPDATTRALLKELETRTQTVPRSGSRKAPAKVLQLPVPLTRFFGREAELAQVHEWLHEPSAAGGERLLTLTGAGGSGKTRLSVEAARRLERDAGAAFPFTGGAWFVSLADVTEEEWLADGLRGALNLPPAPGVPPLDQLLQALAAGPTLLILDNFEQMVPAGVPFVQALLEGLPELKLLVTSRSRLNLPGERELKIAPLAVPEGDSPGHPAEPAPAVALFADRARTADPGFALTDSNLREVSTLCRRLDGIPLAIELAAARANVLTPAQMLGHLDEKLDLLASRHPGVPARHRTLRAAIEWSFRLLPRELGEVWARLSVFRGGWTLEAAKDVCGGEDLLDALSQLCDNSLVLSEESRGTKRFRFLEALRDYAEERLPLSEREEVRRRHAEHYLRLAEWAEDQLLGPKQEYWLSTLTLELDNLRAAMTWATEGEPEMALRLSVVLSSLFERYGRLIEGGRWLQGALRADEVAFHHSGQTPEAYYFSPKPGVIPYYPPWTPKPLHLPQAHWRARALNEIGLLARLRGDDEAARPALEEAISLFERLNDPVGRAWALNNLGLVRTRQGHPREARVLLEQGLAIGRETNQRKLVAETLSGLAYAALSGGDLDLLRAIAPEKLALRRDLADRRGIALALCDTGLIALFDGDPERAGTQFAESVEGFRALDEPWGLGQALALLASAARRRGDLPTARAALRESLQLHRKADNKWEVAFVLAECGGLRGAEDAPESAVTLAGAADALRRSMGSLLLPLLDHDFENRLNLLRERLGPEPFQNAWERGQNLSYEDALAFAQDELA